MYYRIMVNEEEIGVFGHENVERIHLSVGGGPEGMYIFATGVCREGDKEYSYVWAQDDIGTKDKVEIIPTEPSKVREPLKKFLMGRPMDRKPSDDIICDFCQRIETEVKQMIHVDEHRPNICDDCVEMCNAILEYKGSSK